MRDDIWLFSGLINGSACSTSRSLIVMSLIAPIIGQQKSWTISQRHFLTAPVLRLLLKLSITASRQDGLREDKSMGTKEGIARKKYCNGAGMWLVTSATTSDSRDVAAQALIFVGREEDDVHFLRDRFADDSPCRCARDVASDLYHIHQWLQNQRTHSLQSKRFEHQDLRLCLTYSKIRKHLVLLFLSSTSSIGSDELPPCRILLDNGSRHSSRDAVDAGKLIDEGHAEVATLGRLDLAVDIQDCLVGTLDKSEDIIEGWERNDWYSANGFG